MKRKFPRNNFFLFVKMPLDQSSIDGSNKLQNSVQHLRVGTVCKCVAISGCLFFLLHMMFPIKHLHTQSTFIDLESTKSELLNSQTNINHIIFSVVGSMNTWKMKKPYIDSWWLPNVTRGYLFLDRPPEGEFSPWPQSSPPFRINENLTVLPFYHRIAKKNPIRILRSIIETFRQRDKDVRWFVMSDDDTVFLLENLVEVLQKYDHNKNYYIGASSEAVKVNCDFSFNMAFGGAGFALSYPLVEILSEKLDGCIERYSYYWFSDQLLFSCLSDLGVSLTHERGFHQIDLHGDISGYLSAHLPVPLLSLHHFDVFDPIFPSMTRSESVMHLMKPAKHDTSRLLQQAICHHRPTKWSFSVSWGYSVQIYESILPRSILHKPLETFSPWFPDAGPYFYTFSWRTPSKDPCTEPHVFFLENIGRIGDDKSVLFSTYMRRSRRNLPPCRHTGHHSADILDSVHVFSPANQRKEAGKIECCDVEYKIGMTYTNVTLRDCMKGEVIA